MTITVNVIGWAVEEWVDKKDQTTKNANRLLGFDASPIGLKETCYFSLPESDQKLIAKLPDYGMKATVTLNVDDIDRSKFGSQLRMNARLLAIGDGKTYQLKIPTVIQPKFREEPPKSEKSIVPESIIEATKANPSLTK